MLETSDMKLINFVEQVTQRNSTRYRTAGLSLSFLPLLHIGNGKHMSLMDSSCNAAGVIFLLVLCSTQNQSYLTIKKTNLIRMLNFDHSKLPLQTQNADLIYFCTSRRPTAIRLQVFVLRGWPFTNHLNCTQQKKETYFTFTFSALLWSLRRTLVGSCHPTTHNDSSNSMVALIIQLHKPRLRRAPIMVSYCQKW